MFILLHFGTMACDCFAVDERGKPTQTQTQSKQWQSLYNEEKEKKVKMSNKHKNIKISKRVCTSEKDENHRSKRAKPE